MICASSSNTPPLAPSRPHSRKTCEHEGGGGTPLQVPLARPLTERGVHLAGAKTARPTGGCLPKTQVKPGIPEKVQVYPKNTWTRVHMPQHALLPGPLCQLRRAPPAQVRAPHHVCSLQVPKRKRQHRRQARLAGGGADDAVVPHSATRSRRCSACACATPIN